MAKRERRIQVYPDRRALQLLGITQTGQMATDLNFALGVGADVLARATADNETLFSRAKWNLLADANNGTWLDYGPLMDPRITLTTNLIDGHHLNRLGEKWLVDDVDVDATVNEMAATIQELSIAHGWAMLWTIRRFRSRCQEIDHEHDDWWTLAYQMQASEQPADDD